MAVRCDISLSVEVLDDVSDEPGLNNTKREHI